MSREADRIKEAQEILRAEVHAPKNEQAERVERIARAALAERERRAREALRLEGVIASYRESCLDFIQTCVVIEDPQQEPSEVPFILWPDQRKLLQSFIDDRLQIVLKSRQIGISWLACAYALWLLLFFNGKVVLLFSQGQSEADELLRRVRLMYDRLPDDLRNALPQLVSPSGSRLHWMNGSRVLSLPATLKAGRTFTASLVIMDEAAHMEYAETLYTALKPTIDGGGKLIIISTANGIGNLFQQLWQSAQEMTTDFVPHFLSWQSRPGRDTKWYQNIVAEALGNLPLVRQEYPSDPEEAFQATGQERFLPSISLWDRCRAVPPPWGPRAPVILALDAAIGRKESPSDCFAIVAVSRDPMNRETVWVRYAQAWSVRAGLKLEFRSGDPLNPGPEDIVEKLCKEFNVVCICYDVYQLADFANRHMKKERIWYEEFSQASGRLKSDRMLLTLIHEKRVLHQGEPDLRQHILNADRKVSDTSAMRIIQGARGHVDLAVALSMAAYTILELNI